MIIQKILFHINAIIVIFYLKIIYGNRLLLNFTTTFRRGFSLIIDENAKICIGNNCFFNNNCSLVAKKIITIGEGSIFGENVKIYDHNHSYKNRLLPIKEQGYTTSSIVIGAHCWVASNVVILKGVTIGNNCVIGAGCVIYKDIPDNTVVKLNQHYDISSF